MVVCGESGDIQGEMVDSYSWKERLPELVQKYPPEDIWNVDKTGCFWKALPDKGFGHNLVNVEEGKKANKGSLLLLSLMLRKKRNSSCHL